MKDLVGWVGFGVVTFVGVSVGSEVWTGVSLRVWHGFVAMVRVWLGHLSQTLGALRPQNAW